MQKKYYFDTEFIEGVKRPIKFLPSFLGFNKKRWFIELISIGIRCNDGRKYYAISKEFNASNASKWVKENVIAKLPPKYEYQDAGVRVFGDSPVPIKVRNSLYKSSKQIMYDIIEFVCPCATALEWADMGFLEEGLEAYLKENPPQFHAYYADYDWVLFCSLFGAMIDLPKGFPMYCIDLKQGLDRLVWELVENEKVYDCSVGNSRTVQFNNTLEAIKNMKEYPKQENEHSADDDAEWNMRLHGFIQKLKTAKSF